MLAAAAVLPVVGLVGFAGWTARRVRAAVPPIGRFIEVDGHRLHYTDSGDAGSGASILFIHGLAGNIRNFPSELLGGLAAEHRVVAVDRPGSGYSTRPFATDAGLRRQARTLARLIADLGLVRPVVVGHSLGGALALTLALEHPDSVGALALIAPLTQPTDRVPEAFRGLVVRSRLLRLLIAWTLAVPASIRVGPTTIKLVFGPDAVPADYATVGGGLLGLRPAAYFGASSDLMALSDEMPALAARYGSIRVPVGILFGDRDQILAPGEHGALAAAAIPGARLELVEGRGHMLPITAPDRTIAFIRQVVRRVAPSAGTAP